MNLRSLGYAASQLGWCHVRFENEPASDVDAADLVCGGAPVVGYIALLNRAICGE